MPSANANAADFFGEGTYGTQTGSRSRDWAANPPRSMAEWDQMVRETGSTAAPPPELQPPPYVGGYAGGGRTASGGASYDPAAQVQAYQQGNQGATSGYAAGSDATRSAYDTMHRQGQSVGYGSHNRLFDFDGKNTAPPFYSMGDVDTGPTIGGGGVPTFTPPDVAIVDPPAPGTSTPPTTDGAPTFNRENIDPLLEGLRGYEADMYAMSQDNTGLSAAEAQLKKATELANINAAIQSDASQRAALGAARAARNRGDRALLEQQAIGEAGYIGQEAARTAALRQAESEGNLATLRATEENADREFKLKALQAAKDAGLNVAALELDIGKADLGSATNYLNRQFEQMGIDKQLSQQQAQAAMNFAKDMATIQFQYDKLSVDDQNEADRLLMEKYRIDQDTMVALKKIKEENGFDWTTLVSGFMTGTLPVVAGKVLDEAFED